MGNLYIQRYLVIGIKWQGLKAMKLRAIATISTGYSFRSRIKNDPQGNTYVIQMGDVDPLHGVLYDQLTKINFKSKNDRYRLLDGDIIMVSKGNNLNAYLVEGMHGNTIAVNSFITLKIEHLNYQPAYVAWYLNSPMVQHYIHQVAAGTGTPNLSKQLLGEIDIPFIETNHQILIGEVDGLSKKEAVILSELQKKRKYVTENTLQEAFGHMKKYDDPF